MILSHCLAALVVGIKIKADGLWCKSTSSHSRSVPWKLYCQSLLISLFLISMFNTSCSHMSKDVDLQLKLQSLTSWNCRWPTDDGTILYFFFLLLFSCRHIRHTRLLHPCLLKWFLICLWFAHLPRTVLRILSLGRFLVSSLDGRCLSSPF